LVPCSDGAGVVEAVGAGVTRFAVGDRVMPNFAQGWLAGRETREKMKTTLGGPLDGTLRELGVFSEEGLVAIPEHLTDEEAATLPCAAVTAWNALAGKGSVRAGDTVVTLGTGGVSIFVLQLARLFGARVIVTSSSNEKLARAKELGAWHGINYLERPEWADGVLEVTGGAGADHVVELGGAGTLGQSLKAVRPGGEISIIGVLAGAVTELNLTSVLMRGLRLQGVLVGSREHFEDMNRALGHHRLRPVLDRTFDFTDAPAAFRHLAGGRHFGKVVVCVS
ncbi:MAG: NAD(P)-dependent alcohol dehydrogenase, partial [Thermoanaerobaculia bacterium]|nr:NAD(P)-dependent alcohol dehydrogenase [Thermoanaerobaculia bacterium]